MYNGVLPVLSVATILINSGADLFAKDLDGRTPLDFVTDMVRRKKMLETYNKLHPAAV